MVWKKPLSPGLERLNILITGTLAFVSTVLAIIALYQQQEIKGMSNLLIKQDSLINSLAVLSSQNRTMISKLDTTQVFIAEQLNAIKSQTKSNEYSSKPVLDLIGYLTLKLKVGEANKAKIVFSIKNYGYRPASKIKISGSWVQLNNASVISRLSFEPFIQKESLPPNQQLTMTISRDFTESGITEFETLFFILDIEYFDPLTKKNEKTRVFKRQSRDYGIGYDLRISLNNVSESEMNLLKSYK